MTEKSAAIHVLQITDLHLKADPAALWRGHNVQQSLDAILQLASQHPHWPPPVILVTGDIVDDETPDGYRASYRRLAEQLREQLGAEAARQTKIGFIPGNHDDSAILAQSCQRLDLEGCGAFTLADWQFIQLDSRIPNSADGELSAQQLDLLDDALANSKQPNVFIVLHHPLVKLDSDWIDSMRVKNADALFSRVDAFNSRTSEHQVRAIAWGHAHQETELTHRQVRLFGTPAAGPVQFTAGSDDFAIDTDLSAGLRWFTLHPDGQIDSRVFRVNKTATSTDQ